MQRAARPRGLDEQDITAKAKPVVARGKSRVREATPADIDQLVEMSRLLHAEGSYRDLPIHEPKLRAFLAFAIKDGEHACLVYEDRNGQLAGMMAGYVAAHFFSLEKSAYDLFVFVRPARRGSLVAYRLCAAFEAFARRSNARTLCFATVANIAHARTRKFYTGLGMSESGSIYLKGLSSHAGGA